MLIGFNMSKKNLNMDWKGMVLNRNLTKNQNKDLNNMSFGSRER